MDEIITKINYHQKEIYKLEKQLHKMKEELKWKNYDEQQKQVIMDKSNLILVEAFPGSGKTHTILGRVKRLVDEDPLILTKIIMITFTKKAGEELRERIKQLIPGGEPYFVGTFHGLAYRELCKLSSTGLSLLDQNDEIKMIKEIGIKLIKSNKVNHSLLPIFEKYGDLAYQVSSVRYPPSLKEFCQKNGLNEYLDDFQTLLDEYDKEKNKMEIVDFNDLMIKFYLHLKNNDFPNLEKIDNLFFDEYQDVNPIQNQILKILVERGINLMVVGDPRQSIYNFRGSEVRFINDFEAEFKGAKRFILPTNYRSCLEIINLSNDIFHPKLEMITVNKTHKKPEIKIFSDWKLEKKYILDSLEEKKNNGQDYRKMTILSRKNRVLTFLEADLIRRKIPYLKNGGQALLDKSHIKDLLSFLTLFFHPNQKFHWKRILSLLPNVGIKTVNKLLEETLPDYLTNFQYETKQISLFNLYLFYQKVKDFPIKEKSLEIINFFMELGINYNYPVDERENDYQAINQFLKDDKTFSDFLQEIYLDKPLIQPNTQDYLEINSFHGSKGLEWDTVFLVGLNASEIPHYHPTFFLEEDVAIEEERRLFFVACTRAKKELYLTANINCPWKEDDSVSPFVTELDKNLFNGKILKSKTLPSSELTTLIKQYLYQKGNREISSLLEEIKYQRIKITSKWNLPTHLQSSYLPLVVGKFFDLIMSRMTWETYDIDNKKYSLNPSQDYNVEWYENIEILWMLAGGEQESSWKDYLLSITPEQWKDFAKEWCNYLRKQEIEELDFYHKINQKGLFGELDMLSNKLIIEIKSSYGEILTLPHLLQVILYWFIVKENNKNDNKNKINKVLLYNPLSGEAYLLTKTKEWLEIAKKVLEFYVN
jgi:DNA helicase-2/ATP-dependent DNA helicase PcrA